MDKKWKNDDTKCIGCKKNEETGEEILMCTNLGENDENIEIAIKIPKLSIFHPELMHNFYQEATIVMNFDHENILSCLGISTESLEAPYLVFEFMQFGDLATILRQIKEKDLSNEILPLNQVTILLYSVQFRISYLIQSN